MTPNTRIFKVLSLSGGGFLGLYTAKVLIHFEETFSLRAPSGVGLPTGQLHRAFQLVAGTSIGGAIALCIAFGVPARRIADAIEEGGSEIFPRRSALGKMWRLAFGALYDPAPLIERFSGLIGKGKRLDEVKVPIAITAMDLTNNRPYVFLAAPGSKDANGWSPRDVLCATTAAPLYFPSYRTSNSEGKSILFADGGLFANAPDLVAIEHAVKLGFRIDQIRMLSLGTTMMPQSSQQENERWSSIFHWMRRFRLVQHAMHAQMDFSRSLASAALAETGKKITHAVIDLPQPPEYADFLRTDRADSDAIKYINLMVARTREHFDLDHLRGQWMTSN